MGTIEGPKGGEKSDFARHKSRLRSECSSNSEAYEKNLGDIAVAQKQVRNVDLSERSALNELEATSRFLAAVLLGFLNARVSGEIAAASKLFLELFVDF